MDESSKGDRSKERASNVEENGNGSINDEQQDQHEKEGLVNYHNSILKQAVYWKHSHDRLSAVMHKLNWLQV